MNQIRAWQPDEDFSQKNRKNLAPFLSKCAKIVVIYVWRTLWL
jgi:hypothetical protein